MLFSKLNPITVFAVGETAEPRGGANYLISNAISGTTESLDTGVNGHLILRL